MKTKIMFCAIVFLLFVFTGSVFGAGEGNYNSFFGVGAGNGTGGDTQRDTFIGAYAGYWNTTGIYNTFVGFQAGFYNTASYNTFLGGLAGKANTTGANNTFVGDGAGYDNTTGGNNTFIGHYAGNRNTTGINNTFVGVEAGYLNTTASYNTFQGYQAGYSSIADYNTFMGYQAGTSTTSGQSNAFMGFMAGSQNTTGSNNVFIGHSAGGFNTTGHDNTFLGTWAGYNNIEGYYNTFLGILAGNSNTTGNYNTFVGGYAGQSNQTGIKNVFLGYTAGSNETGSNKLYIANSNTTTPLIYGEFDNQKLTINGNLNMVGPYGTLLLSSSTANNTTKDLRIKLNHYANTQWPVLLLKGTSSATDNLVALGGGGPNGTVATQIDIYTAETNTTLMGTPRLTVKGNGYIGLGTQSPSYPLHMASGAYVSTGGVWTNASSREYKDRIQSLSAAEALAALKELNPVKYVYKADRTEKHVGFIAEDVPDLLATKDRKGLSAMDIVATLTKVVQEQQKTIQELSNRTADLEKQLKQKGTPVTVTE